MMLGVEVEHDREEGTMYLHHHTSIMRALKKWSIDNMRVSPVPCTTDLFKRLNAYVYTNTESEVQEIDEYHTPYRTYLGVIGHWAQTSMPQMKTTVRIASKFMSRPTKVHFELVMMMLRYCKYCVVNNIKLTLRRPKGFDGVLKLLMFSDSDHAGNADASSNSGMVSFLNGNYFHGYSSGQKCQTLNTAESEYIAMMKALQFGIWAMLFLRELHFRLMFPIPLLGDNQAAILIAKSPTHTKFARHVNIKYHYIRTILPFKDFILAYVKSMWNIADLNTKPCVNEIFTRLTTLMLDGLHNFEWRKEVNKTLQEIWQAVEARDGQRELGERQLQREHERKLVRKQELQKKQKLLVEQKQQPTQQQRVHSKKRRRNVVVHSKL